MNPNVKEITKDDPKSVCQFCHSSLINSMQFGPMYRLEGITLHYFCLLFSSRLNQEGEDEEGILGFMPVDIRKEIKRGNGLKCKFCKKRNATIGCSSSSPCDFSYHYPCGLRNSCSFQFIDKYASYCSLHKELPKVPVTKEVDEICHICQSDIDSKLDLDTTVWCPRCTKGFHKRCMMEMGRNHGLHYIKCPLCNDKDDFSVAMRKMGIYLPDRDAAWEVVPNAFEEQTHRYRRCDAEECPCPKGREHSSKQDCKPWKIVRCGGCGSSAIHKYCGKLKNLTWRCGICAAVLLDKKKSGELNTSSRIQREEIPTPSCSTNDPTTSRKVFREDANDESDEDESSQSTLGPTSTAQESIFDPRYGRSFAVDPVEETESTEDEVDEDEDDNLFISPEESRLHQQLFGGPPRPIDSTSALGRCAEKANNPDPVIPGAAGIPTEATTPDHVHASAQYIPPKPLSTSSQTSQSESIPSTSIPETPASSASDKVSTTVPVSRHPMGEVAASGRQLSSEASPNLNCQSEVIVGGEGDTDMDICILECVSLAPATGSGFIQGVKIKEENDNGKTLPSSVPERPSPNPENKLNKNNSAKDIPVSDDAEIKIVKVLEPVWPTVDISDTAEGSDEKRDDENEEDSGSDTDRSEDIVGDDDDQGSGSHIQPIPENILIVGGSDSDSDIEILVEKPPSPKTEPAKNRPAILDLLNRKVPGKQDHVPAYAASAPPPRAFLVAVQSSNIQQTDSMSFREMIKVAKETMQNKKPGNALPSPAAEHDIICLDSDSDGDDKQSTIQANNPEQNQGHSRKRMRKEVED